MSMSPSEVRSARARTRSPANLVIIAHGLSSFCLGLAFPYTSIYLAGKPLIGTGGVALFYGSTGMANLVVAVLLSTGRVRIPQVPLCVVGVVLWVAGYSALFAVATPPQVCAAGIAVGTGQGAFLAAIIPIVSSLVSSEDRRSVFARRFAVLNGTLAAGSLVAGLLTTFLGRSVIPYFFLASGIGMLPVGLVVIATRRATGQLDTNEHAQTAGSARGARLPARALLTIAGPAAGLQLAAYLFGFSQFEATVPLVSVDLMHMPLFVVSVVLVVNIAVIVLAQRPMTKALERTSELTGLCVMGGLWTAGYAVAAALSFGSAELRLAGLIAFSALFGLGECAYSCSFHPWLISRVPPASLTQANALANSMMGIGQFSGPSIGVALAATGSAPNVWLTLTFACTVVTALLSSLRFRSTMPVPRHRGRRRSRPRSQAAAQHALPSDRRKRADGSAGPRRVQHGPTVGMVIDQPT
jgi:hypothetical protein